MDILRLDYIQKLLTEDGLNIAGISILALIPCWSIRQYTVYEHDKYRAFQSSTYPCWEASDMGTLYRNTNCRECEVHRSVDNYPDVKSYLKTCLL